MDEHVPDLGDLKQNAVEAQTLRDTVRKECIAVVDSVKAGDKAGARTALARANAALERLGEIADQYARAPRQMGDDGVPSTQQDKDTRFILGVIDRMKTLRVDAAKDVQVATRKAR